MSTVTAWAYGLAESILAKDLPRRWIHSKGVADRAKGLTSILGDDADLMVAAAVLHDIGYAESIAHTGLHPLDGARFLRDKVGADPRIVNLVAYHSYAPLEARARGLGEELEAEFIAERPELVDALCYCDMNTTPDGEPVNPVDRIAEIAGRYGVDSLIGRFIRGAEPEILRASARVLVRLADARAVGQPM